MTRLLVRNAGHEVRTPLNSIINYLESALEEQLDERARLHLTKSLEASKSLVFVVNDLLNLTEAEDGVYATYEDDVDLRSMVSEVIGAFQSESTRKGLEVGFEDDADVPEIVRCNPDGLRQVLSNLLANAIQYSDQGHINIGLYHIDAGEGNPSPAIRVAFQDEGLGLSEQQLDSIFQNFEQILEDDDAKPIADKAKGNLEIGLGLATAARFARLNNGQIFMSSEGEGRGTTVSITIPFRNAVPGNLVLGRPGMPLESLLPPGDAIDEQISPGTEKIESLSRPLHITDMPSARESTTATPSPSNPLNPLDSSNPLNQKATSPYIVISTKGHYPFPVVAAVEEALKLNVLIAEDNPLNSRLLEMRLTKRGHDVEIAVDGQACIEVFKKSPEKFDVILMDIQVR
jgi:CheY-like chemotaxis protein